MIDIATLGLTLCLATGEMDCDNIKYEYDSQLRKDGINGITLFYTKSERQVIKISTEYKNNEYATTMILIHELAHAKTTLDGHSHTKNQRHLKEFRDNCKLLAEKLEYSPNRLCKKSARYN